MRWWSSVLSLAIVTLPAYSAASSFRIGAITRQGGHHAAQKSTNTGSGEANTSSAKLASVTTIGLPTAVCAVIVIFLSLYVKLPTSTTGYAAFRPCRRSAKGLKYSLHVRVDWKSSGEIW